MPSRPSLSDKVIVWPRKSGSSLLGSGTNNWAVQGETEEVCIEMTPSTPSSDPQRKLLSAWWRKGCGITPHALRPCSRLQQPRNWVPRHAAVLPMCVTWGFMCCAGGWKIALYCSRHLTTADKNYSTLEREALAIACCLKKVRLFCTCNSVIFFITLKIYYYLLITSLSYCDCSNVTTKRFMCVNVRVFCYC